MNSRSSIEWTETTWNPVTGCTQVSPGCKNCYALRFAERWRAYRAILMSRALICVCSRIVWKRPSAGKRAAQYSSTV